VLNGYRLRDLEALRERPDARLPDLRAPELRRAVDFRAADVLREPVALVGRPLAALTTCFCSRSRSRWSVLLSLPLPRRAFVTNFCRSL
jgi:hypothetical protein